MEVIAIGKTQIQQVSQRTQPMLLMVQIRTLAAMLTLMNSFNPSGLALVMIRLALVLLKTKKTLKRHLLSSRMPNQTRY